MRIKEYLGFIENKFIYSTDTLFISYQECNQTHQWESRIINLITKQHFQNLHTLNPDYPLSLQLNIPISSKTHRLIITNPNLTNISKVIYEEELSHRKHLITKQPFTTLHYTKNEKHKYTLSLNPYTLTQEIDTRPHKTQIFSIPVQPLNELNANGRQYEGTVNLMNQDLFDRFILGHPDSTNRIRIGDYDIHFPHTDHRDLWDQ